MPEQDPTDRLNWLTDWVAGQRAAEGHKTEPDMDPWGADAPEPPEPARFELPTVEPSVPEPSAATTAPLSGTPAGEPPSPPSVTGLSTVTSPTEQPQPGSSSQVSKLRELIAKAEVRGETPAPPASRRRRPARLEEPPPAAGPHDEEPERRPGRRRAAAAAEDSGRDPAAKARDICLQLLAARPRTRVELQKALLRKGIEAEVTEQVLGRLDAVGLIDDKAFAEMWVHSRHTYQGMGRRALAVELRRRGVDNDTAAEAVASVDSDAEEDRARHLVRKRLPALGSADQPTKIRRLVGMLARKGYPQGLAYRVVKEELATIGEDTNLLDTLE